jgi:hypothetical protein
MTTTSSYLKLEDRPVVLLQLFPTQVLQLPGDGGPPALALLVLTRGAVYVWTEPGEPVYAAPVLDFDLAGTFDPPGRASTITTADGQVSWVRGQGCGCHHRLKGYKPFSPLRLATS